MRREPRPLTGRQEAVLAVIRVWLAECGRAVREIGARVGPAPVSAAHQLGRFKARGLIVRTGRRWPGASAHPAGVPRPCSGTRRTTPELPFANYRSAGSCHSSRSSVR
ncbi:LexA family protein [Streptomyces cyaneofuscatus]|uniref:LexA family protein n=1 Tax=Streptomyces cyaneofuscatus TaxID=66883 RepID=UPI00382A988B